MHSSQSSLANKKKSLYVSIRNFIVARTQNFEKNHKKNQTKKNTVIYTTYATLKITLLKEREEKKEEKHHLCWDDHHRNL